MRKVSQEQWEIYKERLAEHERRMREKKPMPEEYDNEEQYKRALAAWDMEYFCDAPNEPGYYRANND